MCRSSPAVPGRGQAHAKPLKRDGNGEFGENGKKMAKADSRL